MACTVVSAFYSIKSKAPKEKYIEWGKTFLSIDAPIVLFTEEEHIPLFKSIRGDKPIHIINIPFNEIDTWKLYHTHWINHHKKDPENRYHTPELYAIWAQKPFFVEKAIHDNPFHTDYFFWCDFGAFRNIHIDSIILKSFPTIKYLPKDKIILQSINNLPSSEKLKKEDGIYGECINESWNECRLVGGLWGGGIEGCLRWKVAYKTMLEKYFCSSRFAGKDQIVMLSAYLDNPTLAVVVSCTIHNIDIWFYFQYLLSNLSIPYKIDDSYIINL
jgi:hypothetical protein